MAKVKYEYALGNHVYQFAVILFDGSVVPYQVTFERDLYVDRSNVTLLNFYEGDDNKYFCLDVKETVIRIFNTFFGMFPYEKVYFETDLSHKRNYFKLMKFIRWAEAHSKTYNLIVDVVNKPGVYYAYITITKK